MNSSKEVAVRRAVNEVSDTLHKAKSIMADIDAINAEWDQERAKEKAEEELRPKFSGTEPPPGWRRARGHAGGFFIEEE